MLINKKTNIVATLGPATNSKETLTVLARSGVNVFRINMSHIHNPENLRDTIQIVRAASEKLNKQIVNIVIS